MIKYFLENKNLRFERKTDGASGYDVMANLSTPRGMSPGERWLVSTGLYLSMPKGVEAQVRSRSGLSLHHGVVVLNAPGTIDSDYRGECCVTLINLGQHDFTIVPGERIAQIVFCPVLVGVGLTWGREELCLVHSRDELGDTVRGASGHGSTGR